jgi:hypothetical protein
MENTKKMKLVPYEVPSKPFVTSVLSNKLLSLDVGMEKVLQDKTLSADEKVQKYTAVMQNYMDYKKQLPTVHDVAPVETMTPMSTHSKADIPHTSINKHSHNKLSRKRVRKVYGPFNFNLKWLSW